MCELHCFLNCVVSQAQSQDPVGFFAGANSQGQIFSSCWLQRSSPVYTGRSLTLGISPKKSLAKSWFPERELCWWKIYQFTLSWFTSTINAVQYTKYNPFTIPFVLFDILQTLPLVFFHGYCMCALLVYYISSRYNKNKWELTLQLQEERNANHTVSSVACYLIL